MITKGDAHVHAYKEVELIVITRINNNHPDTGISRYNGTAGDKALILKLCECGKKQGFDCGSSKEMRVKYKQLENKFKRRGGK